MPNNWKAAQRTALKTKPRGKQNVQYLQTHWRIKYITEIKKWRTHLNSKEPERERIKDTNSQPASKRRNREMEGKIILKHHLTNKQQDL